MPERKIVGLIIGVILIAVVGAYFIFKVFGLQPDIEFPKGKETLVRYYACSLAICTHGCDWLATHKICLDNDTVTQECNLWCEQVCRTRFRDECNDAGICCGPEYNLTVSLAQDVNFKGCYQCSAMALTEEWSDIYNNFYVEKEYWYRKKHPVVYIPGMHCPGSWTRVLYKKLEDEEGFPKIIGNYENSIIDEDKCALSLSTNFPGQIKVHNQDEPNVGPNKRKAGLGHIYVFSEDAYGKYGCVGDCECGAFVGRHGFDYCIFKENINIWSDWQPDRGKGCADVFFNSTVSAVRNFDVDAKESGENPCNGDDWCAKINLGETAKYTVKITNNLGSGKTFILHVSDNRGGKSNCMFWKESPDEEIDEIIVRNGGDEDFYMSCTPEETGTYIITITAGPSVGYTAEETQVRLVVANYEWWVIPEDEQNIPLGNPQSYTIRIDSEMSEDKNFNLHVETETIEGGSLSCIFENDDDDYTFFVPDGVVDQTTITCNHDGTAPKGKYRIRITSSVEGLPTKEEIRILSISGCDGEIRIEFEYSAPLTSGKDLKVKAAGLSNCQDRSVDISVVFPDLVIKHCGAYDPDWDGETCILDTKANTPGDYTVYAFIDKNNDGDTNDDGESDSTTLTINEPSVDERGACEKCNGEWCAFSLHSCNFPCYADTICKHCQGIGCGGDCIDATDPQSCEQDPSGSCSMYSNICCISAEDGYYSNGLGPLEVVPCLSPDQLTDKTQNDFFIWGGIKDNNARNVLVDDEYFAEFEDFTCSNVDDCYGGAGAPQPLQRLLSQNLECHEAFGPGTQKQCRFDDAKTGAWGTWYDSWLYIQIAPTGESRPIYGILVDFLTDTPNTFSLFIHDVNIGWYEPDEDIWRPDSDRGIVKPSSWSWDIDAMLLGGWINPGGKQRIDYVGLLTNFNRSELRYWRQVPFCTKRPSGVDDERVPFYGTVDDGEKCYWNVDCPTSGTGWDGELSKGVGPFKNPITDNIIGGCDCSFETCGEGFCYKDNKFCYYNVTCANGGWRNPDSEEPNLAIEICDPSEDCTYQGCV